MTEEERTREVQRISERSSRSVKVPQEQQKDHPDRPLPEWEPCKLRRNPGRSNQKGKRNGMPLRTNPAH